MKKWSLSNDSRDITHQQFIDLTTEFFDACNQAFGTECSMEIEFLTVPKVYTTFMDDAEQARIDEYNQKRRLATISRFEGIDTEYLWDNSRYVGVAIKPVNEEKAPTLAFAHVEFKGNLPRSATYFIRCQVDEAYDMGAYLHSQHDRMIKGDGYTSHGDQSGMAYIAVSSKLGIGSSKLVSEVFSAGKFKLGI